MLFSTSKLLVTALLLSGIAIAQTSPAGSPMEHSQASAGGASTGGAHAAVLDAQKRPITAGGFVKTGPIVFQDIAAKAGLNSFHQKVGTPEKNDIIETLGSGVALLDYDNDGWLDIYLVNGSTYEAQRGTAAAPHAALFHNNHDGTFTDVTDKAGVANERWGIGAVSADYDNDGWPDIFVSNYGKSRLYHNNHDGTFTDVAEKAGVTFDGWAAGATWGDYDGDGKLDLFVPGYVHFDMPDTGKSGTPSQANIAFCSFRGVATMCGPHGLKGESDKLYHNNGDGTFTDVSEKAGVDDKRAYYGLASLFIDVNGDGKPDLLVADDSTPNYLYLNKGDGTFEDASYASGYALNESGRETASMGIASGDYLHNGLIDLFNTTFSDDYKPLYRNDGDGNFTDVSFQLGIAEPTVPFLGWGTAFLDYDNDGWLDLFVANGHVYPQVDRNNWGTSFKQRALLLHNIKGKFEFVPAVEGTGLAKLQAARGMTFGDLFNNGRIDVVTNNMDDTPSLFENVADNKHHWIELKLQGTGKSNRDAVGATVLLTAEGFTQRGDVIAGGSFASSPDKRVHFGLGDATTIDKCEIRWPDGTRETVKLDQVDRIFAIVEGRGISR
ncbi:MAG: CRTAC1 family protein [Terriglobus roseus]|nr:CRTAC1 family protein [Terriglobus roseus]